MSPHEACAEWVRILRALATGEMSPTEALAKRPEVREDSDVPSAFWSARDLIEQEIESGSDAPEFRDRFREVMRTLADRIEAHPKARSR